MLDKIRIKTSRAPVELQTSMKISRVIVYVGVVTGVCGLKLNSGNTAAKEIGKRLDLTEISNIDDHLERYGKLDQVEILYLQNTDVSDIPQLVRNMPQPETDLSVRLQKFQGHICVVWSTEDARSVSDKRDEHFCVVWSDVTRVALCRWDKSHRHLFFKRK